MKMSEAKLKSQKGGRYCCIKGCPSKYGNKAVDPLSFYRFPSNNLEWRNVKRQKWVQAVIKHNKLNDDWQPKKYTLICSAHFIGRRKSEHPLHPSYIPTIFPGKLSGKGQKIVARTRQCLQHDQIKKVVDKIPATSVSTPVNNVNENIVNQQPQIIKVGENCDNNKTDEVSAGKETHRFSDTECQVNLLNSKPLSNFNFDYLMCNLKIDNNLNCAETQVNLQNVKHSKYEALKSGTFSYKNETSKAESIRGYPLPINNLWLKTIEFYGISSIHSNNELTDVCGVTFEIFNHILKNLPEMKHIAISNANRLLIFLTKLKQGISNSALAILFNMPKTTISKIFTETLQNVVVFSKFYVHWPSKNIKYVLPESFKDSYPNCKAIIDCLEIQVAIPDNPQEKELFYSKYKDCQNFKLLLACAPNGFIMYKSKCYSGLKSNDFIVKDCNFLNLLSCGDVILADKEFRSIKTLLEKKKVIFVTPPFTEIPGSSSIHIDIKQSLHQIKLFKILSFVPVESVVQIDDIVQVCCSLINLQTPMKPPK